MDRIPPLNRDPDLEWLDLVQPTGLVLSPTVIKEQGLVPERQTGADSAAFGACLSGDEGPALSEPWPLFEEILGWDARFVAGAPGGPALPDDLAFVVPEHDTMLVPDWAAQGFGDDAPWQLLVRFEPGVDPDRRGAADGWEASPHQRFERLLRETGALVGVMLTDTELRLIYAPRGETSGWLAFPLRSLATVAGRPMLAGLKLLLGGFRLFNARSGQRLHALLQASRDAQAAVSTELAGQVLGALHELLRGLNAAEPAMIQELARERPDHLYEGLLAVLLRLVFILYAEDRDLLPSATDGASRALYEQSYAVRGLYAKLSQDAALNPDTMDERLGGWGRLLALFRMIHKGHTDFIRARRGKLFDPDIFPFLEGRSDRDQPPRVIKLGDGCLLRILEGLMTLPDKATKVRQRLSYRTLDVEQIGSVYETIMGFTVETAPGRVLAIRAGKHNRTPVFADLHQLAGLKPADRPKYLKDVCKREGTLSKSVAGPLGMAADADAVAAALDGIADERGSPKHVALGAGTPILQPTEERRRTGSHYTPRTLSSPIVHHALRPILERLGPDATPEQILALKVCDPAMGSGAFLVEACRQLAERLVDAWARHPGTRPNIPGDEDEDLLARRLVAQRCLYGVDRNPMAVDLARLSLWLVTLARDHEFTFLDHALKAGDSLVGLDRGQIEALHWDAQGDQLTLTHMLVRDRLAIVEAERQRIREAVEDASEDDLRPILKRAEQQLDDPKLMADAVIAAFFKGAKSRDREALRADVRAAVEMGNWREPLARLRADLPLTPFHWPLEFPEVFDCPNGGFDAIVGNPPFLGGLRVSNLLGMRYFSYLVETYVGAGHLCDLVAYFFRRAFQLSRNGGSIGMIATNSIGQGDTREGGLSWICDNGGFIYRAIRRYRWPGEAAVIVSVVHLSKGKNAFPVLLDNSKVDHISAFLLSKGGNRSPARLAGARQLFSQGVNIRSPGFLVGDAGEATTLKEIDDALSLSPRSALRVKPYIGGRELNDSPTHEPTRKVIFLSDIRNEEELSEWPELTSIVMDKVKPERDALGSNPNNIPLKKRWWAYHAARLDFYEKAFIHKKFLCGSQVTGHVAFVFQPHDRIIGNTVNLFILPTHAGFAVLQARAHEVWARFFGSSMKDDLRYTPSDCFETFPFPEDFESESTLEAVGERYYAFRAELMVERNKGLTKTYNDFHDRRLRSDPEIQRLRELHHAMDQAVLRAYGWDDLAESAAPIFLDETNEDEFAYQGRLFWPSDFRDEVLARLLALNAERHADEVRRGVAPGVKRGKGQRAIDQGDVDG